MLTRRGTAPEGPSGGALVDRGSVDPFLAELSGKARDLIGPCEQGELSNETSPHRLHAFVDCGMNEWMEGWMNQLKNERMAGWLVD